MKMFNRFIKPRLAEVVELERPAIGLPERLFRFSLIYFVVMGLFAKRISEYVSKEQMEHYGGIVSKTAGIIFVICFVYMLNYMTWRYVNNKYVKIAWWSLMSLIAFFMLMSVVRK